MSTADPLLEFFASLAPQRSPRRLSIGDGRFRVEYLSEADLRRQLTDLARLCGWLAEEEVVVPGWGRIDIVLREAPRSVPRLIELKLDLTKPSQIRRGFQQADGYGRWWTREKGEAAETFLISAEHTEGHVASIGDAYPTVEFLPVPHFMTSLWVWGDPAVRRPRAADRLAEMQRWTEMQARAIDLLDGKGAS
jgi:hypothetical protein